MKSPLGSAVSCHDDLINYYNRSVSLHTMVDCPNYYSPLDPDQLFERYLCTLILQFIIEVGFCLNVSMGSFANFAGSMV